jgi:Transposase DDE domain
MLEGWETTRVIADKGYDAQSVLDQVATMGAEAVIPPKNNRKEQRDFDKEFYSANGPPAPQARQVLV